MNKEIEKVNSIDNIEIKKEKYINNIFVFLIIYLSSSSFMHFRTSGIIRIISIGIVTILLFIIKKGNMKIKILNTIIFFIMLSIQVFNIGLYGIDVDINIYAMLILIASFVFTNFISFKEFCISYQKVMYFLCLFSTVMFLINIISPNFFSIFPNINSYLKNVIFTTVPIGRQFPRNAGIFIEAGIYQIFINYSLIIEFFYVKKPRVKYVIVYLLCLITTMSTNGIIVGAIIMIGFIFRNKSSLKIIKSQRKKIIFIFCITIILCIILFNTYPYFKYVLLDKISEKNTSGSNLGSGGERWRAILFSIKCYISSPILGVGINFLKLEPYIIKTCTPLNWFAIYGTVYGIICNLLYLAQIKIIKDNILVKIIVGCSLTLLIISQAMTYHLFTMLLIFYGASINNT